jgi:tetratricopeptide (TPR) repeat protein
VEIEAAVLKRQRVTCVAALLVALSWVTEAAPRWSSVKSESLTVIGDAAPGALRDVARRLEQFRIVLGSVVSDARRPPTLPTLVYVFGSRSALQPFLPQRHDRPVALRGYFHRDADGYAIAMSVDDDEDSSSIVFHEYAHLLVQHGRTLPIWLNEGLAEYFSTFALTSRGRTAEIGRPVGRHVRLLRERFLPLAGLLTVSAQSELYDEGERRSVFYAEAWALTHYLLTEMPNGPALMARYTAEPIDAQPADQRFLEAFGVTPAEFEPRLKAYVASPTFRSRVYTFPARIDVDGPPPARTLSQGEADARLGDLQRRIGRQAEAAVRIEQAVREDPGNATVHLGLGRLRLDQGRAAEALASLSRAVEIDPSSANAFAWLAYAQMAAGHVLDARTAIGRALALEPGRPDFRLRDADVAVLEGDVLRARSVLLELIAGDAAVADRARERLNAIDRRR